MIKTNDNSVKDYLNNVPEKRKEALLKIKELCLKHLPDHTENMSYNLPSYVRNNQVEVAFANRKQGINIYFLIHSVMLNKPERLKGLNHGKGCLRFSNPDKIDYKLITTLLNETHLASERICR